MIRSKKIILQEIRKNHLKNDFENYIKSKILSCKLKNIEKIILIIKK